MCCQSIRAPKDENPSFGMSTVLSTLYLSFLPCPLLLSVSYNYKSKSFEPPQVTTNTNYISCSSSSNAHHRPVPAKVSFEVMNTAPKFLRIWPEGMFWRSRSDHTFCQEIVMYSMLRVLSHVGDGRGVDLQLVFRQSRFAVGSKSTRLKRILGIFEWDLPSSLLESMDLFSGV